LHLITLDRSINHQRICDRCSYS